MRFVSPAREALAAMIISRSPVPDSLYSSTLRRDEDAMACQRNPAYIGEQLIDEHLSPVFIAYLANVRRKGILSLETARSLMDSASRVFESAAPGRWVTLVF
jgi:hypothetical protein